MAEPPPASSGSAALPYPPPAKPFRSIRQALGTWHRVHRIDPVSGEYAPDAFNDSRGGDARFSPLIDPATGKVIPTIYAAQTPRGAIAEVVLHDVPMPSTGYLHDWERDKVSTLHLSAVTIGEVQLVNLKATGLRAVGLEVADLFRSEAPDYPRTRQWALHIWQQMPTAQGLIWMSVRDNSCPVVMLFGDRVAAAQLRDAGHSRPIAHYEAEVFALLDELGCGIQLT